MDFKMFPLIALMLINNRINDFMVEPVFVRLIEDQEVVYLKLAPEEQSWDDGEWQNEGDVRIQVRAPKMHYPYIDGASMECERLSEQQMEQKRYKPEVSITCTHWK